MGPEKLVERVEHDAGFHRRPFGVTWPELIDSSQIFARIDDERLTDSLAGLGGPGAPRQYRYAVLSRYLDCAERVILVARHHHPDRLDLIHRGVRAITAAAERVKENLALQLSAQLCGER